MPFDFVAPPLLEPQSAYRRLGQALTHAFHVGAGVYGRLIVAWLANRERRRMRRQLLGMDDRMLRDIGISRCDASQGVTRTLWRP